MWITVIWILCEGSLVLLMEDDKDWAGKMTAANALASPSFHLWQTASSTASCPVFGRWALPELQGDTADISLQCSQESFRGRTPEDHKEFFPLKQVMPSESLGSTHATAGRPCSEPFLSHVPSPLSCSQVMQEGLDYSSLRELQAACVTKRPWKNHEKDSRYLWRKYLPKETPEKAELTLLIWQTSPLLNNSHWLSSINQISPVLSSLLRAHFFFLVSK